MFRKIAVFTLLIISITCYFTYSQPKVYLSIGKRGVLDLSVLGEKIELVNTGILWVREYTRVLGGVNLLKFSPKLVKGKCFLKISGTSVNISLSESSKAVVKLGECSVEGELLYVFTALSSGWNGFIDAGGGPLAEVWCVWTLSSGKKVYERLLVPSGSTPVPRRYSNFTEAPVDAVKAEVYLVAVSPKTLRASTWIYVESPALIKAPLEAYWRPVMFTQFIDEDGWKVLIGELDEVVYWLRVRNLGEYALIEVVLENKASYSRALDVGVFIPLKPENWVMWIDPRTAVPLIQKTYGRLVNSLVSGGYLPISLYPVSAVSSESVCLGLGIPLTHPEHYVFAYFPGIGYGVFFEVALTERNTKHSKAVLKLELYGTSGGLREIIADYYSLHLEWFTPSINITLSKCNYSEGLQGFAQGWFESPSLARKYRELTEEGAYLAEYVLPWEYEPVTRIAVSSPPPSYWYSVKLMEKPLIEQGRRILKAKVALATCPRDENGYPLVVKVVRGPNYRPSEWVPKIPMNPDPDLPGYNVWNYTVDVVSAAIRTVKEYGYSLSGVELDNFMARSGCLDFRKEAIEACNYNLVYDPNTFKPAVHLSYTAVEYLARLKKWIKENIPGGGLTGNFVAEGYANFGLPYLDALPFECSPRFNWGDVELLYRRFAAGYKPVLGFLAYRGNKSEVLEEYVETLIFYGIMPSLKDQDRQLLIENAALFEKLFQVYKALQKASWRPVTLAKVNSPLIVEQFGEWPQLYFTVHNPSNTSAPLVLEVDLKTLNNNTKVDVKVIWGEVSVKVFVKEDKLVLEASELKPKKTAVFLLTKATGEEALTKAQGARSSFEEKSFSRVYWSKAAVLSGLIVLILATVYFFLKRKVLKKYS